MTEIKQATKTTLLYLEDAQKKMAPAVVVELIDEGKQKEDGLRYVAVILDQTLFYPQGGGQPADQGTITGPEGTLVVTHVSYNGGAVLHKGVLTGSLHAGETVTLAIDWPMRERHMQWHTAGHIVDLAVKNVLPESKSIDGNHGIGKKLSVTFTTPIPEAKLPAIQAEVTRIIKEAASIITQMMTKDEIIAAGITLPFDLPTNKPLRIMQIGNYPAMPDGETHLQHTNEAWPITIVGLAKDGENTRILYQVQEPQTTPTDKGIYGTSKTFTTNRRTPHDHRTSQSC